MSRLASTHTTLQLAIACVGLALGCSDSYEPADNMRAGAGVDDAGPPLSAAAMLDPRWHCPQAEEAARPGARVRYSFQVVDFVTREPRGGVEAKACRNNDLRCDEPLATFVDTAGSGFVQLELPPSFIGFLQVTSDTIDTLLYITRPLVKNTIDRDLTMPTPDSISLFALLLDYPWDMDKGIAVLEVLDCEGGPRGGVHFQSRDGGDPFYIFDGVPIKDAQTTVYDPVAGTAEGGFINVPAGTAQFSAQVGTEPDALELGTFSAQIRPRTMTIIELRP
jgi:hypothetical protein